MKKIVNGWFPNSIDKQGLRERYEVSQKVLSKFIPDDLKEEIGWANKLIFTPEETHRIFMAIDTSRYMLFLEKEMERTEKPPHEDFKNAA